MKIPIEEQRTNVKAFDELVEQRESLKSTIEYLHKALKEAPRRREVEICLTVPRDSVDNGLLAHISGLLGSCNTQIAAMEEPEPITKTWVIEAEREVDPLVGKRFGVEVDQSLATIVRVEADTIYATHDNRHGESKYSRKVVEDLIERKAWTPFDTDPDAHLPSIDGIEGVMGEYTREMCNKREVRRVGADSYQIFKDDKSDGDQEFSGEEIKSMFYGWTKVKTE